MKKRCLFMDLPTMRRAIVYFMAFVGTPFITGGCTVAKVARAYLLPNPSFYKCTADSRIECQPGSEKLAQAILPAIAPAQRTVEEMQYCEFSKPVVIRTYASRDDFSQFSGSENYAEGAVSFGVLHLSPKLLLTPERIPGIVIHELSHLNLALKMGTWSWAHIPGWFHEGLATWVSAGGGAETVASTEAMNSIKAGHRFSPEDQGLPLIPKSADSYKLKPHMYYRQASMFVEYLHDSNPAAFRQLLLSIEQGQNFSQALKAAYNKDIGALWNDFLANS